jgi:autotransporter-associated beta strand protein
LTVRQGAVLDLNGAGITALSAGTVVTGGTVVAAGTFNGAGTVTNSAAGTLVQLSVGQAVGGVFSGVIQDGAGQVGLNKYGPGILALTGTNTFTGPVTINDSGSLWVTSLADIGVASALGAGDATNAASNAGSLIFNNGTLRYTGSDNSQSGNGVSIYQTTQSASVSTNRLFTISGVFGGIESSGTYGNSTLAAANTAGTANNAAIVFSNTGDIAYSGFSVVRQLQLMGTSQGDNTMRVHLIDDGAVPLGVLKSGVGLWELNPATANTYSGQTEIDGGVLRAQDGMGLSSNSALVLAGGWWQRRG